MSGHSDDSSNISNKKLSVRDRLKLRLVQEHANNTSSSAGYVPVTRPSPQSQQSKLSHTSSSDSATNDESPTNKHLSVRDRLKQRLAQEKIKYQAKSP